MPAKQRLRLVDWATGFLMPPSVDGWLRTALAQFAMEVMADLDLRWTDRRLRRSGEASTTGPSAEVLPARHRRDFQAGGARDLQLVAFRFIAANQHPDHVTIAAFRRRFLKQIEKLFVQVLLLAREMGMLKMGTVALDGTKVHANANRHSALSYEQRARSRRSCRPRWPN